MFHQIKLLASGILLVSLVLSCSAETTKTSSNQFPMPILWEIEKESDIGPGKRGYLFGTMHISDPRVTTLHPAVQEAFDKSDAIFTELKESPLEMMAITIQRGMLPKGTSLRDVIGEDTFKKLDDFLRSKKMSVKEFAQMRPWMVGMQLQLLDAMPYMQGVALDLQLIQNAVKAKKETGGVETMNEQLAALAYGNEEEQVTLFRLALDKIIDKDNEGGPPEIEIMLEHYLSGDVEGLWNFAEESMKNATKLEEDAFDALLANRNTNMATRIDKRFKEFPESTTFYAFGALHFAGPDSVGKKLEDIGYKVTRVTQ